MFDHHILQILVSLDCETQPSWKTLFTPRILMTEPVLASTILPQCVQVARYLLRIVCLPSGEQGVRVFVSLFCGPRWREVWAWLTGKSTRHRGYRHSVTQLTEANRRRRVCRRSRQTGAYHCQKLPVQRAPG